MLKPEDYKDFEAFFSDLSSVWDSTWKEVNSASTAGAFRLWRGRTGCEIGLYDRALSIGHCKASVSQGRRASCAQGFGLTGLEWGRRAGSPSYAATACSSADASCRTLHPGSTNPRRTLKGTGGHR